jgi:hypothetical protein
MEFSFRELFRSSLDDVMINWELFYPKLYAMVISSVFFVLVGLLSFVFLSASEPVGYVVVAVLSMIWFILVLTLLFVADLVIVEMVKEMEKGRKINKSLCIENSLKNIGKYFAALVPVSLAKTVLVFLLLVPVVYFIFTDPSTATTVDFVVQVVSLFIELVFAIFFVLLPQVVVLEKLGVIDTLKRCIEIGRRKLGAMVKYVFLRTFADLGLQFLAVIPMVILLIPIASELQQYMEVGEISTFSTESMIFITVAVLLHIVLRLMINSLLIVMDTRMYYQIKSHLKRSSR